MKSNTKLMLKQPTIKMNDIALSSQHSIDFAQRMKNINSMIKGT